MVVARCRGRPRGADTAGAKECQLSQKHGALATDPAGDAKRLTPDPASPVRRCSDSLPACRASRRGDRGVRSGNATKSRSPGPLRHPSKARRIDRIRPKYALVSSKLILFSEDPQTDKNGPAIDRGLWAATQCATARPLPLLRPDRARKTDTHHRGGLRRSRGGRRERAASGCRSLSLRQQCTTRL